MKSTHKTCGDCGKHLPLSNFCRNNGNHDGLSWSCGECRKAYYREYMLPAIRGRGKACVMPDWVSMMISKPTKIPAKVIKLEDYVNKDHGHEVRCVVAGGKKS
jgi:hypothetical protein